jgi:hypothetical protein
VTFSLADNTGGSACQVAAATPLLLDRAGGDHVRCSNIARMRRPRMRRSGSILPRRLASPII